MFFAIPGASPADPSSADRLRLVALAELWTSDEASEGDLAEPMKDPPASSTLDCILLRFSEAADADPKEISW
jgi:hypothetical protein